MSAVRVYGIDKAIRDFRGMSLKAVNQEPVLSGIARRTAARITGIPVRTGALQASVRRGEETGDQGFVIASDVRYAPFVFYGTEKMPARPPHIPPNLAAVTARASLEWVTP